MSDRKWLDCYFNKKYDGNHIKEVEKDPNFEPEKYEKAKADIIAVLGEKEKYNCFEAAHFIQYKYYATQAPIAFEIPIRGSMHPNFGMFEAKIYKEDLESGTYWGDETYCFDGFEEGKEHCMAFLIDIYNNRQLWKDFPITKEYRDLAFEKYNTGNQHDYCQLNELVVIGSYDQYTINSMLVLDATPIIQDLAYEMLYFYHHS